MNSFFSDQNILKMFMFIWFATCFQLLLAAHNNVYDFIVVGAGTAGAVVASRLSEDPSVSVLLLEAGNENDLIATFLSEIPAEAGNLQLTSFNWKYETVPQKHACFAMNDQICLSPRGKALGGSSRINYMLYVRGNRADYDGWASLGNPGWSYDEVLPFFKKSEQNLSPVTSKDHVYHCSRGLLAVSEINYRSRLASPFLNAVVENGYEIGDYNGESQLKFMHVQETTKHGRRYHTGKAFLRQTRYRRNIDIVQRALVSKVLIDPISKVAYGVEYEIYSFKFEVMARKEVILCAGAFGSPQLLMLSGIGPEEHLRTLDIEIVKDLPGVGENLVDHIGTSLIYTTDFDYIGISKYFFLSYLEWMLFGRGVLTLPDAIEVIGFTKTELENSNPQWSDIQHYFSLDSTKYGVPTVQTNVKLEVVFAYFASLSFASTVFITTFLTQPKSRGTIKLRSRDIHHHPLIDPDYYSHPNDIKIIVSGLKQNLAIGLSKPMKDTGVRLHRAPFPGCEDSGELFSDEYLECYARQFSLPGYHYSGTCKMGNSTDNFAVVDARLRVYGIKNLRVIDASIMPFITSGNTNAPSIMIGEKGASFIIEDHGLVPLSIYEVKSC